METIKLHIYGMACSGCANTVRQALMAVDGVTEADVSHVEGWAEVTYDPAKLAPDQLKVAVRAAGYSIQ